MLKNILTEEHGNTVAVFTKDPNSLELNYAGVSVTGNWKIVTDVDFKTVIIYVRGDDDAKGKIIIGDVVDIVDTERGRKQIRFTTNTLLSTGLNWPEFNGFNATNPVIYVKTEYKLIKGEK